MTNPTYASDLTERQWHLIKELLPPAKRGGRPRTVCLRAVLNALLYLLVAGCAWKMLPANYPHWRTVYGYFRAWQVDGTMERVHGKLRRYTRRAAGKRARPTAASVDSQCVKSTALAGPRGFDAFKKVKGRKRHIVVDTLGLLLAMVVTPANVSDTAGAKQLFPLLARCAHRLKRIWCDGGYFEGAFEQARAHHLTLELVQRPQGHKGFYLLAKRWVVERTFAWLTCCRRLAREYERTICASHAFVLLAMTRIMLNRLAPR
ncbi:IS5 family transposase [bacterium]|nr:MAG: IS5 family transposase [bacterium]